MRREARSSTSAGPRGRVRALLALALAAALAGCAASSTGPARGQPTNTPLVFPTRTPTAAPADPTAYGWVRVAAGHYGSAQFAASSPQRGYLCATDDTSGGAGRVFGVSADGGQTWQLKPSPAAYPTCMIRVSPTDPQHLTLSSVNLPGDGQSAFVDAHYSIDGGQTWQSVPFPPNTLTSGEALWAGASLFMLVGGGKGQSPMLAVSANGGPFAPIDLGVVAPGVPSPNIEGGAIAAGNSLYLNVYGACAQTCVTIAYTADGGKTWKQIPNPDNLQLQDVIGTTLYADQFGPNSTSVQLRTSADGGATWGMVTLPALPNGSSVGQWRVAPDGTLFTATPLAIYMLRGQTWTPIPFASGGTWAVDITGFATDAAGHPTRVFVSYEGPNAAQFSHTI